MVHFVEVAFHRFPRALGSNTEFFVIVTVRTARSKRIAEPESALHRNAVGNVGESGSAFVGSHHQIRVGAVVANGVGGGDNFAFRAVIGHVE